MRKIAITTLCIKLKNRRCCASICGLALLSSHLIRETQVAETTFARVICEKKRYSLNVRGSRFGPSMYSFKVERLFFHLTAHY